MYVAFRSSIWMAMFALTDKAFSTLKIRLATLQSYFNFVLHCRGWCWGKLSESVGSIAAIIPTNLAYELADCQNVHQKKNEVSQSIVYWTLQPVWVQISYYLRITKDRRRKNTEQSCNWTQVLFFTSDHSDHQTIAPRAETHAFSFKS